MNKKSRYIMFILGLIILISISRYIEGSFDILHNFWFSSGILMVILLSLIDQPFFSKDANIFVNAVTGLISLSSVSIEDQDWIYKVFLILVLFLLLASYYLMYVRFEPKLQGRKNVILLSAITSKIGRPQILFSAFFLWGAFKSFSPSSKEIKLLFWFWLIFLLLCIPEISSHIFFFSKIKKNKTYEKAVGKIMGVQSKQIFLVNLYPIERRKSAGLKQFDVVEFLYKLDPINCYRGFIIDSFWLNEEQWAKVLVNNDIDDTFKGIPKLEGKIPDIVYKLASKEENTYLTDFVGCVTENSTIGKLRFVYNSQSQIEAGQLIGTKIGSRTVFYQLLDGCTKIDLLEAKNESSKVIGEAFQLGIWDSANCKFDRYGWVPSINTPVKLITKTDQLPDASVLLEIGHIPHTNYPILMDVEKAISHHMAILGVTGTGKSVFSRFLLKEISKNRKILIFDLTEEYSKKIPNVEYFTNEQESSDLLEKFENIISIKENNYGKPNNDTKRIELEISTVINQKLNDFITSDKQIAIVNIPALESNESLFDYIKFFFRELFSISKSHFSESNFPKLCVAIEEAHTIIPEWNFVADSRKGCQPAINAISQIALQGRKYNVGLLIVAQRSANVSKNILSQCNSIVTFQEFDNTSIEFLSNYYGDDVAKSLPTLKPRQAIATGKAFNSTIPIIFEVKNIIE